MNATETKTLCANCGEPIYDDGQGHDSQRPCWAHEDTGMHACYLDEDGYPDDDGSAVPADSCEGQDSTEDEWTAEDEEVGYCTVEHPCPVRYAQGPGECEHTA